MELWELLAKSATKGASRGQRAPKAPERDAKLTFDKRALNQRADEINAFDNSAAGALMSNVSSFFRPAGVAARRLIGEDNVRNLAKSWKQQSDEGRKFEADKDMRRALSWTQGLEGNMPSDNALRDLPNLNVLEGGGELLGGLGRAYRNAVYGPPAQDVLTDKAKRRLAEIKASEDAQAQRIAALRRGADQNLVERIAETVIAPIAPDTAEMFQRRQKDLSDIALEEGWTTSGAIAGSMLNPLEWINAEGKAATAAKLKNAGKARKAINEVGRLLDPVQVGLDAIGDIAKPVSEELAARAWEAKQAKKVKPEATIAPQDAATRARRYLGMDPNAAPVESAAGAADVDPLWQRLVDDYEAKMARPSVAPTGSAAGIDWSVPSVKSKFTVEAPRVDESLPAPPPVRVDESVDEALVQLGIEPPARPPSVESIPGSEMPKPAKVKAVEEAAPYVGGEESQRIINDALRAKRVAMPDVPESAPLEDVAAPRVAPVTDERSFEQWFNDLMGTQDIAAPLEASVDNALPEASLGTEASQSTGGVSPRLDGGAAEPLEVQGGRPIDMGAEALPEPGVAAVDMVDNVAAPRMDEGVVPQSAVPDRIAAAREYLAKQRRGEIPVEQIDEGIEPAAPSFAMERPASKPITQRVESDANVAREVLGNNELRAALREESGISGELAAINKVNEPATPTVDPTVARMQRRLEELRAMPSRKPRDHQEMIRLQDQLQAMNAMPEPGPLGKGRVPRTPNPDTGDGFVTLNANLPSYQQVAKLASNVKRFIDDTKAAIKRFMDGFENPDWLRGGKGLARDAYVAFRRIATNNFGIVDKATGEALSMLEERANIMTRTVGDAFDAFQRGDLRFILGRDAQNYNFTTESRSALRQFAVGRLSEAEALKLLPADAVEVGKVFRQWMDDESTKLMAEQYKLQHAFLAASSDEQLEVIRSLTESAANPRARGRLESAVRDAVRNGQVNYDVAWYSKARDMVDQGYRELESAGLWIPGDEAPADMLLHWAPFIANRGKYDPRLYHFFIDGIPSKDIRGYVAHIEKASGVKVPEELVNDLITSYQNGTSVGSLRDMDRIKRRKDLPEEFKRLLMEVNDPSYTFSVGIAQVNNLKEKLKARRWAASHESFVSRPGETREEFMARNGYAAEDVRLLEPPRGREKAYGALRNRWVHFDFHDMLHSAHVIDDGLPRDHVHNIHQRIVSAFKTAKTVLAPASQFRQLFQNTWAVYANGGLRGIRNMSAGAKEYANASPLYIEARGQGIFAGRRIDEFAESIDDNAWRGNRYNVLESFAAKGVDSLRGGFLDFAADHLEHVLQKFHDIRWATPRKAAKLWQLTDDLARMALYKTYREAGDLPEVAASKVKDAIYSGLRRTRLERMASMSSVSALSARPTPMHYAADAAGMMVGIPFFGAVRYTASQAAKDFFGMKAGSWSPMSDPARFARWWGMVGFFTAMHGASKWVDGLSSDEEVRQRPDYMRDLLPTGFFRLPARISQLVGGDGTTTYMDTRWLFPAGSFMAGAFDARTGSMRRGSKGSPDAVRPTLPGLDLDLSFSPLLQVLVEGVANRDGFTGNKIYSEFDSLPTKSRKMAAHAWRAWLPPILPNPIGGAFDAMTLRATADDPVALKARLQAFFQGLANDSGHNASRLASGIWNEFDYWFDKHGQSLMKESEVTDYRGRPQRLLSALAGTMGIRLDTKDIKASEEMRQSAKKKAVADMRNHYKRLIKSTQNGVRRRELMMELREAEQRIKRGEPDARWYDDVTDPDILYENVFNTIRNARNIKFVTPANAGPLT